MPTFPNTITLSNSSATQGTSQPFQVGANVYQMLANKISQIAVMWKSTDNGVTWNVVDALAGPAVGQRFGASKVGTTIYCVNTDDLGGGTLSFQPFNTLTDTWGANIVTLNEAPGLVMAVYFRASDSKIIVSGTVGSLAPSPGRDRSAYCLFDTVALTVGAWVPCGETGAGVTESWTTFAVIKGNGCSHLIFLEVDNDGVGPGIKMVQQALSDANALSAKQIVDTGNNPSLADTPCGDGDGTNIIIGWTPDLLTGQISPTFKGVSSTGVIAFTQQNLDRGAGEFTTGNALALVISSGIMYGLIMGIDGATFSIYTFQSFADSGTGFGAGTIEGISNTIGFVGSRYANSFTFAPWGILLEASAYFWSPSQAPPPAGNPGTKRINCPDPVLLPDPRIFCIHGAQKRCVDEPDGRNYTIQNSKGIYGVFK